MTFHSNLRILVVDDFSPMRKLLRNALREIGFTNVLEANDGTVALRMICNDEIHLVVCDWNMPDMSGIELLRWLRNHEEFKGLPFLMVTSKAEKANVVEAIRCGANSYVVKPFTAEILQAKINQIYPAGSEPFTRTCPEPPAQPAAKPKAKEPAIELAPEKVSDEPIAEGPANDLTPDKASDEPITEEVASEVAPQKVPEEPTTGEPPAEPSAQ